MSREYCPRNLDKILPFVGSRVLVIHTRSDSFSRRFGRKIKLNASGLKAYLIEHVPKCQDCLLKYNEFLNGQRRGNQSREDINKEYLGISI